MSRTALILGNQLFPIRILKQLDISQVFMAECYQLATHGPCHKQKIVLFLSAMRHYRDELIAEGIEVSYVEITEAAAERAYHELCRSFCEEEDIAELYHFEIEDHFLDEELKSTNLPLKVLPNPNFICQRTEFKEYLQQTKKPFMKTFYERQRKKTKLLMEDDGPEGGKFSFDSENRKKLPKGYEAPKLWQKKLSAHDENLINIVADIFADAPGELDRFVWPTTRIEALDCLDHFIANSLEHFGDYQDAIDSESPFLNHCLLSPAINMGLLTPHEVALKVSKADAPLNAREGFVRQIIGWREFVRGIYHNFSERLYEENQWEHERPLNARWYKGNLGIPPVDDAIKKANTYGYNHHIERLMVVANFMNLCEIKPLDAYRWFMEMFVDSSDWVMAPNVFGMGLTSTANLFATKPYISSSNYILKMSSYKKGPWCEVWDGLYWRFIATHRERFRNHPRMAMMVRQLEKMPIARFNNISQTAESFLESLE